MSDSQFVVDSFSFLHESIPTKSEVGLSLLSSKLTVTCFDINERLLVFGSDCGAIYGFRRGEKAEKRAHFRMAAVSTSITAVKLIECDLLAFTTGNQLIVYRLSTLQIVYLWKNEHSDGLTVDITTFIALLHDGLYLLSGDKVGSVCIHRVSESKQERIFKEMDSEKNDHVHEVVQIECSDTKLILVSTCLRSVIVRRVNDSETCEILQIGKNSRKSCGKYGAVFYEENLFAARPSLHLIRGSKADGNVIETLMLKKAKDPPPISSLCDVRCSFNPKQNLCQLGSLITVATPSKELEFIISWNSHSFLIIGAEGQLLIKEFNLCDLIDVKTSLFSNFVDIFLLFKNRTFLRLRHEFPNLGDANFEAPNEENCNDLLQGNTDEQKLNETSENSSQKSEIASSFTTHAFGQIGELKKIFVKIQNKLTGEASPDGYSDMSSTETASNSDISESEPRRASLVDECVGDVLNEPLVVHKKIKRVKHKSSKIDTNSKSDADSRNECIANTPDTSACDILSNTPSDSSEHNDRHKGASRVTFRLDSLNESNRAIEDCDDVEMRLSNILKAFRMDNNTLEEKRDLSSINEEATNLPLITESHRTHENLLTTAVGDEMHTSIDSKEAKSELFMAEIKWNLVMEGSRNVNKIKILSLCASSYDDQIGVGYVWLSCLINKQNELYYLPSFKNIKCPVNKSKISSLGVNTKQILVLYEDGSLYCRSGDSIKPLADKWTQLNANRPQCKLSSISVNNSNCVVWCCDVKCNAWMLKLSANQTSLVPIRDDNEFTIQFKVIVVAPQESSLVWAISVDDCVYMRNGIFNENGRDDELIAGISWIKVDVPVIPKSIAVTSHSVWLLNDTGNRIFRRVGIEPPFDLMGHSWQEVKCPTLVNDCVKQLSASLNDDIWLLTRCGSVWQHCQHPVSSLEEVESDWILVR